MGRICSCNRLNENEVDKQRDEKILKRYCEKYKVDSSIYRNYKVMGRCFDVPTMSSLLYSAQQSSTPCNCNGPPMINDKIYKRVVDKNHKSYQKNPKNNQKLCDRLKNKTVTQENTSDSYWQSTQATLSMTTLNSITKNQQLKSQYLSRPTDSVSTLKFVNTNSNQFISTPWSSMFDKTTSLINPATSLKT